MIAYSEAIIAAEKWGVPIDIVEKDYCLNWILIALASLESSRNFIFYGGTAIKKIYFDDYRFSEDLDLIVLNSLKSNDIIKSCKEAFSVVRDKANIDFKIDEASIAEEKQRFQFLANYDGFSEMTASKILKFDFTFGYEYNQDPVMANIACNYSDMVGLDAKMQVCSLDVILTDKIGTILSSSRNEPRDIYDLQFLIKCREINFESVKKNFKERFGYEFDWTVIQSHLSNSIYRERWKHRLSRQISNLPEFDLVVDDLLINIKKCFPAT